MQDEPLLLMAGDSFRGADVRPTLDDPPPAALGPSRAGRRLSILFPQALPASGEAVAAACAEMNECPLLENEKGGLNGRVWVFPD